MKVNDNEFKFSTLKVVLRRYFDYDKRVASFVESQKEISYRIFFCLF